MHPLAFLCLISFLVGISYTMTLPPSFVSRPFPFAHTFLHPLYVLLYETTFLYSYLPEDVSEVPEQAALLTHVRLQFSRELLSPVSGARTRVA